MSVGGETVPPIDPEKLAEIRDLVERSVREPSCAFLFSDDEGEVQRCGKPARVLATYAPCGHGAYFCDPHANAMIRSGYEIPPVCVTHPFPAVIASIEWTIFS